METGPRMGSLFLTSLKIKKFESKVFVCPLPDYSNSIFDLMACVSVGGETSPSSEYLIDSRLSQLFELSQHNLSMRNWLNSQQKWRHVRKLKT